MKGDKKVKKIFKIAILMILAITMTAGLMACDSSPETSADTSVTGKGTDIDMNQVKALIGSMSASDFEACDGESDYVLIKVKDYGDIVVVLRGDVAPKTVKNFKKLVSEGFYNGTVFHRVIEEFMIQGGGYVSQDNKLNKKSADSIKGEFTFNGHDNNLRHFRGVISMARIGGMNDSASSEFFIVHETNRSSLSLDGSYASFGFVLAGMDVVDAIATCEVDNPSSSAPRPTTDIVIESITFVKVK